jgi:hypothetical protein
MGAPATTLCCSGTAPDEMQNEKHNTHDEQDVNHTGTYVKCEKPKQPKNYQNQGE